MVNTSFHYDSTLEHRTTHAKWARGVAMIYFSAAVLLLVGIIVV